MAEAVDAEVARLAGDDRYDTSRLAAEELLTRREVPTRAEAAADTPPVDLVFASGENWPDALGAGAAAAHTGAVFLLAHATDLDRVAATRSFLEDWDGRIGAASVAGGPVAITAGVITEIAPYVSQGQSDTEPITWPTDPSPEPTVSPTATASPTDATTREPDGAAEASSHGNGESHGDGGLRFRLAGPAARGPRRRGVPCRSRTGSARAAGGRCR